MSQLVDDCLNLRVLDPAMGSGHFLVEVVDFASNKLIDFLNGYFFAAARRVSGPRCCACTTPATPGASAAPAAAATADPIT